VVSKIVRLVALSLCVCGAGALSTAAPAHAAGSCPWMNHALRPAARAAELLRAMSLSDKLALLSGVHTSTTAPYAQAGGGYAGYVPANPRLCIPALTLNDGGAGVADDQVGTTVFPAPIAQAATWDTDLQQRVGQALGLEAWRKGIDVLLAPDVNIARVPENGRNFEAFGEDPFLSAQTATAEIEGIQQNPVIATVKHYAVNSQETNRYYVSSNLDERTLREIYLPPFEAAVGKAHVGAVMCAYGLVDGAFSCQDPWLLTTVLRQEYGFDGIVMSDWNATPSAAAANAGLDLEMPTGQYFGAPLADAVAAGDVASSTIATMARHILTSMFRLGLFDHPPPPNARVALANVSTPADRRLALQVAEEGTVLLKNTPHALPFDLPAGATIAVIGAPAGPGDIAPYVSGGGSAYVAAANPVSPLDALTTRAAKAGDKLVSADGSDPAAAAALAAQASVAIVFAYDQEGEGTDRPGLDLPNGQDQLIEQVAEANPHTVVVLDAGGPVLMPWLDNVAAVLDAWYPGQEDGDAIAAILFGDVAPSGKLPQTFPSSDSAVPTSDPMQWPGANDAQDAAFTEGIDVGYRWYDAKKVTPLFPFGYGLSYTTFAYSGLRLQRAGANVTATFTVRNTGRRAGAEVAELYVDEPVVAQEPPRQLKGYDRVFLRPGQSVRVSLTLTPRAFAYWSTSAKTWLVAPGLHRILVGASSRDIRLRGFIRQRAGIARR
jgi:beta-glucosidase